jgi:hypothetical protein
VASDARIRAFLKTLTDELDPFDLIRAWDNQHNDLKEFIRGTHEDLVIQDQDEAIEGRAYYLEAIGRYEVEQTNEALEALEDLLEDNIRQGYLDDGMLTDLCFEVLREEVKSAVEPNDGP